MHCEVTGVVPLLNGTFRQTVCTEIPPSRSSKSGKLKDYESVRCVSSYSTLDPKKVY